jgi:chromosome partitioning protein
MARTDADRRTIALLNQKGGVGKTTSTVNLGAAIAEAGRSVCLIDLDPQAHLTLHLGIDGTDVESSVYDLFVDPDVPAESVRRNIRENLDLLPAIVDLAAAEVELADHPDRQRILKRKLEPLADQYEFILIDCPPSLGLLTLNALALAREVFVPMQAHFLALQGVGKLLETVGLVCRSVNPTLEVSGIILCMHEGNTTLSREVVADLEGFFEQAREQNVPWRRCRVLQPPVRRNIKLAEAPSFGSTIFDYEPWCPGAIDYRRLAKGIIAEWDERRRGAAGPDADQAAPAGRTAEPEAVTGAQPAEAPRDLEPAGTAHSARIPDPAESVQPAQSPDPAETPESARNPEPAQCAGPAEAAQPAQSAESAEITEPTETPQPARTPGQPTGASPRRPPVRPVGIEIDTGSGTAGPAPVEVELKAPAVDRTSGDLRAAADGSEDDADEAAVNGVMVEATPDRIG